MQLSPTDDLVQIDGRVHVEANDRVRLAYPGIALRLRWRGRGLRARLRGEGADAWFGVRVDERPAALHRVALGPQTLALGADLDGEAVHEIEILRRTEAWQGTVVLEGLEVEGEVLEPPRRPARRLLCIGDSITCGAATDSAPPDFDVSARASNAARSYGFMLGARLGAAVHLVSYGGRGLVRDYTGSTVPATAPQFFERSLPDDPSATWDHASWIPDLVTVMLGTNDFSPGIPDQRDYVAAYRAFVRRILETAPGARVILCGSPVIGLREDNGDVAKRAALHHYLRQTAEAFDTGVHVALPSHQPGTERDPHPTGAQHQITAAEIETVVRGI